MQDFRGIQISHAGQGLLIEQRDLDRPSAAANPPAQFGRRDLQGVGPDLRRAVDRVELLRRDESHDAQPALVPEQNLLGGAGSSMTSRRCLRSGGSARKTRPVMRGSMTMRSPESSSRRIRLPSRPTRSMRRPTARRRNSPSGGSIVIGCKGDGGRTIFAITAPAATAIPRRMVSTSGSSGIKHYDGWVLDAAMDLYRQDRRIDL